MKKLEIGSIFEIDVNSFFDREITEFYLPFMKNGEYKYTQLFNTGRSAIEYLFKSLGKENKHEGNVLVPSFVCSSVTDAIKRAGFSYEYYKISKELKVNIEDLNNRITQDVKYIFIVHYFGTYSDRNLVKLLNNLKYKGIEIIEDVSHALYTYNEEGIGYGDYVLGSIRKWIPIPDGGFLSSKRDIPKIELEEGENTYSQNYLIAQIMKFNYLNEKELIENSSKKTKYLDLNSVAMDSLFNDYTLRNITKISDIYIKSYDMDAVISKRVENYDYLYENIKIIQNIYPLIKRKPGEVPFGFVIFSDKRDSLFRYLIDNDIYCNIHWKLDEEKLIADSKLKHVSNNIMTIPCDQRYGIKEMDYIINTIKNFHSDYRRR